MSRKQPILLPGTEKQLEFLLSHIDPLEKSILVMGGAGEPIAEELQKISGRKVEMITEDFDSFINATLILEGNEDVEVKMMDFGNTDFDNACFDLVYAQASISNENRKQIIKEVKRILKTGGIFCAGEIVLLQANPPSFVKDILVSSNLDPLAESELTDFYTSRNFEIIDEKDLSNTLKEYYSLNERKLFDIKKDLSEKEKSYYKKLINQMRHEANAYLNLGADKYIGFKGIIARKK
jgi:ubiquinone/menaquinone biosynthesis C-methylase UbiE